MNFSRENDFKYIGRMKGREEGILTLVESLAEIGVPNPVIIEKMISKYGLREKDAEAYLQKYYFQL